MDDPQYGDTSHTVCGDTKGGETMTRQEKIEAAWEEYERVVQPAREEYYRVVREATDDPEEADKP